MVGNLTTAGIFCSWSVFFYQLGFFFIYFYSCVSFGLEKPTKFCYCCILWLYVHLLSENGSLAILAL